MLVLVRYPCCCGLVRDLFTAFLLFLLFFFFYIFPLFFSSSCSVLVVSLVLAVRLVFGVVIVVASFLLFRVILVVVSSLNFILRVFFLVSAFLRPIV